MLSTTLYSALLLFQTSATRNSFAMLCPPEQKTVIKSKLGQHYLEKLNEEINIRPPYTVSTLLKYLSLSVIMTDI